MRLRLLHLSCSRPIVACRPTKQRDIRPTIISPITIEEASYVCQPIVEGTLTTVMGVGTPWLVPLPLAFTNSTPRFLFAVGLVQNLDWPGKCSCRLIVRNLYVGEICQFSPVACHLMYSLLAREDYCD